MVGQQVREKLFIMLTSLVTLVAHLIKRVPLIEPSSIYKQIWDLFAICARMYYLFLIPIDLAWMRESFIYNKYS